MSVLHSGEAARRARRILTAAAALLAGLSAPVAATDAKLARVGLVSLHAPELAHHVQGIREELRRLGYIDGETIEIEAHFTNGDRQRARDILNRFVEQQVDVIVPWTTPTVQIAKDVTRTIPLVMIASDPIAAKIVPSLSRPGGNITGISMSGPDLAGKRLELLREIKPDIRTVAFLGYGPGAAAFVRETREAADRINLKLLVRLLERPDALDDALFASLKAEGAQAVIVQPFFTGYAGEIAGLALKAGLPTLSDYPSFAKAGALASLGVDLGKRVRRAAYFIDRVLKGAKPADLPVEQPTDFELAINLRTAKALGLTIPQSLIVRAEEIIE